MMMSLSSELCSSMATSSRSNRLCAPVKDRPLYHILGTPLPPPSNATTPINDMNALFSWGGLTHAMMQVDVRNWGHLVSADNIHWRHLPDALVPSEWYDNRGVWDGTLSIV